MSDKTTVHFVSFKQMFKQGSIFIFTQGSLVFFSGIWPICKSFYSLNGPHCGPLFPLGVPFALSAKVLLELQSLFQLGRRISVLGRAVLPC